uniref:Ig-like domain-containing protein n=1 Tax=Peromyscus maniculatus bairdii TaxID=230844 RepID=A0A8C8U4N0_PERMB
MELTSAPFHKAEVFWRGFLLTVSLLTYWTSPTTAQITVEVVPPHVAEGQNILLVVHNLPARYAVINWYKGQGSLKKLIAKFVRNKSSIENGPGYTHRETIYPNGSLFINNVKMEDEELYTLHLEIDSTNHQNYHTGQSSLWVNTLSLPITTKNSNPLEGEDSVALMCEPRTQNAAYLWRIHGQSLDNRILTLLSVVRTDTGPYECTETFYRPGLPLPSADITYDFVLFAPDDPDVLIISPSNIHFHSRTNLSLSCHTDAKPPPYDLGRIKFQFSHYRSCLEPKHEILQRATSFSGPWKMAENSEGERLSAGTLHCLSTEPVSKPFIQVSKETNNDLISVLLNCFSFDSGISIHWFYKGQSLKITNRMQLSKDNNTLKIVPARRNDSGDYYCKVSNQISSKNSDPIKLEVMGETGVQFPEFNTIFCPPQVPHVHLL